MRALTVFRGLFARPRGSLDTTFGAIIVKARLIELLMVCHVFPPRSQSPHRVFVCKTHVFPPLNSGNSLRKKTPRLRISLMAGTMSGRMLRELHHDEGTPAPKRLENLLSGNDMKTCSCYRCLPRAERTYPWERHESRLGRDCLCLPID